MNFPIVSTILFLPAVGVLLLLLVPGEDETTIRRLGVAFAFLSLVLATLIWVNVAQLGPEAMQLVERYPWIAEFQIEYHVGVDGLSAPLVWLVALLMTLALFYAARRVHERVKEFYILLLLLQAGMTGVLVALDLILFYAFWELSLVPAFLLIAIWGGVRREAAGLKFFLHVLAGSVLMLLAILTVYFQTGTFALLEAAAARPFAANFGWANIAFWGFVLAFAIQLPIFPLHAWLPDAHTEAPTAAAVLLSGGLLKLGGYGLLRIALPFFPQVFRHYVVNVPLLPILAVLALIYGALLCLAQTDLKRLVAYSSLVQMAYVLLGVSAAAAAYGWLGEPENVNAAASALNGAAWQLFAHGLSAGALFFLAGMLHARTGTGELAAYGGLAQSLPHFYGLTLVAALGLLGLPGVAGFWGILFVFRGTVRFLPVIAYVGLLGLLLTAAFVLWKLIQPLFLLEGKAAEREALVDLRGWEKVVLWPLVLLLVGLGLYPGPLLATFNAALTALLEAL